MKTILFLSLFFLSLNSFSQSVTFSGKIQLLQGQDISKAKKSDYHAIIIVNHPNSIKLQVNGIFFDYKIKSHSLTDSGRYLKYITEDNNGNPNILFIRSLPTGRYIISFGWDLSTVPPTMALVVVYPTEDDKRILGINDNF